MASPKQRKRLEPVVSFKIMVFTLLQMMPVLEEFSVICVRGFFRIRIWVLVMSSLRFLFRYGFYFPIVQINVSIHSAKWIRVFFVIGIYRA